MGCRFIRGRGPLLQKATPNPDCRLCLWEATSVAEAKRCWVVPRWGRRYAVLLFGGPRSICGQTSAPKKGKVERGAP